MISTGDMEGVKFWAQVKAVNQCLSVGRLGDVAKAFVIPTMV